MSISKKAQKALKAKEDAEKKLNKKNKYQCLKPNCTDTIFKDGLCRWHYSYEHYTSK